MRAEKRNSRVIGRSASSDLKQRQTLRRKPAPCASSLLFSSLWYPSVHNEPPLPIASIKNEESGQIGRIGSFHRLSYRSHGFRSVRKRFNHPPTTTSGFQLHNVSEDLGSFIQFRRSDDLLNSSSSNLARAIFQQDVSFWRPTVLPRITCAK